jgi:hypothetical protein
LKVFGLVFAVFLCLISARYFVFAYQGLVNKHIPAHRRRAFDIQEAFGTEAVSEGWKMLGIASVILLVAIGIAIYTWRCEDDV